MVAAFCTATYLMPLMMEDDPSSSSGSSSSSGGGSTTSNQHHDIELAHVALSLLSVTAAFVGAALGSLLPRVASGATLGYGMALWMGASTTALLSFSSGSDKKHEEEQQHDQLSTEEGSYGYNTDNFTTLFFALGCPIAALLGGILTAR